MVTEQPIEPSRYQFDEFVVDVPDRQLWRGDERIDLNTRYLDALVLLVRERNQLVEKERFFVEVWNDVVVSDSALTQCIKEIRKQLGDNATKPRFVQTVPRHGYRFIGDVKPLTERRYTVGSLPGDDGASPRTVPLAGKDAWKDSLSATWAGTIGGGMAGLIGGLFYGYALAAADAGVGTLSTLLVLVNLCALVGLTGGFGVSFGMAGAGIAAQYVPRMRPLLRVGGAAAGGLFVGSLAKLLGVDAFNLLIGRAPAGITGGPEGALLGGLLALGAYMGYRLGSGAPWKAVAGAGVGGAIAGALIPLAGGNLMAGSLDLLARSFSESRLELDRLGPLFGETGFGSATRAVLGGIEGLLFGACVVGALVLVSRFRRAGSQPWRL